MKVCFFADTGNLHLRRISASLAARGHQVHVVGHKAAEIPGVHVERFAVPPPGLMRPHRWARRRSNYLRGFFRRFDAVVLLFLSEWGFDGETLQSGCLVAFPQGSDIVPPPGETPPSVDLVAGRRDWLQRAAIVGTCAARFASIVAGFAGIDIDRIGRLPLGVDTAVFTPRARRHNGAPTVGFLKGFREVYGGRVLVEAVPRILERAPQTRFEMVGGGPALEGCRARADELGVGRSMRWLPRRAHHEVPDLVSSWDLSVMPSHFESFGVAAVECAAVGVPVIASNVGGFPDSVRHGETGLLVEPGNPSALADAVVGLLSDHRRRDQMGKAAVAWARDYHEWTKSVDRWEETLEAARANACIAV